MPGKYHAQKVTIDGERFDSKAEGARYVELKLLRQAGEIDVMELHPVFQITLNGYKICKYIADFRYRLRDGSVIVEDVKGVRTAVYRLKKKLVKAQYGIDILETGV